MPSFDCGGDACGRYSCHSCTSESVRGEYWRLLGVLRDADKARIATDAWLRKERHERQRACVCMDKTDFKIARPRCGGGRDDDEA